MLGLIVVAVYFIAMLTIGLPDRKDLLEPLRRARSIHETPDQLDSPVGPKLFVAGDDREITLDTASNRVFP